MDYLNEAFYYVSRSREKKMHRVIGEIKEDLNNPQKKEEQKKLE